MNKITKVGGQDNGLVPLSKLSPGEIGLVGNSLYIMRASSSWTVDHRTVYGMRLCNGDIWFDNPLVTRVTYPIQVDRNRP